MALRSRREMRDQYRLEAFRLQFLAYLRIASVSFPINKYLENIYANENANSKLMSELEPSGVLERFSFGTEETSIDTMRQSLDDPEINPRLTLRMFKMFHVFRLFTTVYFVYVVIKFILLLIERSLAIKYPIHCYLAGRLVLHRSFEGVIALIFAIWHLSWRLYQSLQPVHRITLWDFCLLSERELELIYSQLKLTNSIDLALKDNKRLSPRSRQVLEAMCYKVKREAKVSYKLRPNRTRESHKLLRRLTALMTLINFLVFLSFTASISAIIVTAVISDESYMDRFPGCDPEMELRRERGDIAWLTLTPHRIYIGFMDFLENFILYSEGGLVAYIGMSCMILLNLDLVLLWKGIDKEIDRIHGLLRTQTGRRTINFERRSIIGRPACIEQDIQELITAIWDFFQVMLRADRVISPFLKGLIISSIVVCSLFTLSLHQNQLEDLPIEVTSVLLFILSWIISAIYGFLVIHHYCVSSHTKFCSLIALDPIKSKHRYEPIVECYSENQSCFTLMNQRPLKPTTFLAMVGWTFSCFAIISSLLRERRALSSLET